MIAYGKGEWLKTEYFVYTDRSYRTLAKYDEGEGILQTVFKKSKEELEAPREGVFDIGQYSVIESAAANFTESDKVRAADKSFWIFQYYIDADISIEYVTDDEEDENVKEIIAKLRETEK